MTVWREMSTECTRLSLRCIKVQRTLNHAPVNGLQSVWSGEPTLVRFAIKLDLVGLHHFLNRLPDVAQAHVDAGVLQQTSGKS